MNKKSRGSKEGSDGKGKRRKKIKTKMRKEKKVG